ncbi:uncharacterized protein [Nicotiana tomentosiformis]|uniref:uncharacterized protein n=1 Tax=Nicotiana tomentosiformis TaxID=4098 RepID=UPI00388C8BAC
MGLDPTNQSIDKNVADESFKDKIFAKVTQILDKMAEYNQVGHSKYTTGGLAYGTPSLTNMIKDNQERDQTIAGLATNVNVLTKMFTESQTKKVKEKVIEALKTLAPIPRPPSPFPQRLARKFDNSKLEKFYDILKQLSVNIPFVEAFQEMPGFSKYLKDLITKNKTTKNEVVNVTYRVSSIIATTAVQKKEDPRAFTIPCTIGLCDFA